MTMWYICDFFVRDKEAVSNQLELLASNNQGSIIAATRFMQQRALRRKELDSKIYILPPLLYFVILPAVTIFTRRPIHYFEEEPSKFKRVLFNTRKRSLYISMYRRPTSEYAKHLKGYKHLSRVFVELNEHRNILLDEGMKPELIHVSPTPAKIPRSRSQKAYDTSQVTIVFASWNNSEKNALHERGLLYLLDLIERNPALRLEIPLRDAKTTEFENELRRRKITSRVKLLNNTSSQELIDMFDRTDFVAFVAQARVTKDVPNSLLDGLMRGKPVIISTAIDFHTTVSKHNLGIVIPVGESAGTFSVDKQRYRILSNNAYKYAKRHTPDAYLQILRQYEGDL